MVINHRYGCPKKLHVGTVRGVEIVPRQNRTEGGGGGVRAAMAEMRHRKIW